MSDGTFQVAQECCTECLFSEHKIVDDARRKQIIQKCLREDRFFICHKATITGQEICCRAFYDKLGAQINLIRIALRLRLIEFVDVEHLEKKP